MPSSRFTALADVLNLGWRRRGLVRPASTLTRSFAALTEALTALSLVSPSTAQRESLLPESLDHLDAYSPHTTAFARAGVVGMSQWVDEMRGIGETLDSKRGWEVYRIVAEDTILGRDRVEQRVSWNQCR